MTPAHDREAIGELPNPLGLDGIEFIEYSTSRPQALGEVFETLGFRPVARHRSREVLLYRQGDMNLVINAHASGLPAAVQPGPVPQIAAAEEFSRIPLVTPILTRAGAFYVRRGVGKALPEVREELARVVERHPALMFFIEGQRSRGRHVLPPKRGLLRALQGTGRPSALIPIAISYERIPEESAFERELSGGRRSAMSLEAIVDSGVALSVKFTLIVVACSAGPAPSATAVQRNRKADCIKNEVVGGLRKEAFVMMQLRFCRE